MTNELTVTKNKLTPDVWSMIESVALASFESKKFGLVRQGEASIKILFCYENDLPLTAANTGLYIVNGKLAIQSNIIAAKFKQHPNYRYTIKRLDNTGCEIEVYEKLDNEWVLVGVSSFLEKDAKKAGLLSKEVWRNYARNMYFGRGITNAYRWFAPDLLSQPVYIPEELDMKVDGDGSPIIDGQYSVISEPKQMTAIDLCNKYGVDAAFILAANSSKMPSTQDEIKLLDTALPIIIKLCNGNDIKPDFVLELNDNKLPLTQDDFERINLELASLESEAELKESKLAAMQSEDEND